ncbi:MAG: OB-fold nucleic acid binding domain-containing protein [Candidatus Nanoarchaeia archaeon]|nr:OB-fold nucleic acid binding domain-containing protein [Candidatus Nanoarchaeia archaeon]
MTNFIRDVAHRVWIKDIKSGTYLDKESEFDSNFVLINNKKISRVYLIATVIQTFENENITYANITIDDGSADIRVKAWNDLDLIANLKIGDLILLIGKLRKYEDEIYIVPEIVKKVNPNWELVHKGILLDKTQEVKEIVQEPREIKFR